MTTLAWDDQLRRCLESDLAIVACSSSSASAFADESATGAYKVTYAFGGGQTQTQAVKDGKPAWIVSGVADYDPLGRVSRGYKIRFLPSACPQAGSWCDSIRIVGDPLRSDTAAIQIAYDAQGRVIRTYGPGWPRCDGDPSAVVQDSNGRPTGELKCDPPYKAPQVNDVTKFSYPAPGDTIAIDANNVPTLTHQDTRGLITLFQEYVLPPSTAPPGTPPTRYSAVSSTYDQLGRLVGTRDQNNNASLNTYDALSRLRTSTDPDLGLTAYEYNLRSQLIDRFAASGEKTHHEYDAIGRLTQTDYLRPRLVPGGASPTPNPSAVIPWPVPWCYVGADMSEPIRFGSVGPGPDPPPELETVSLAGSDANVGQVGHAQIELPFDLTIRTTAQVSGGASSLRVSTHEHRFLRGTTLVVRTTGQIRLGGSSIAAPQSARGRVQRPENPQATLDVLTTPSFTLAKDGLRYGVFGESGSRRLVIEWAGTLSERTESMLARATITEGNSIIRYDYVRVPPSAVKGAGIRLVDGASKYIRTLEPGRAGASPVVGSQASFSFGDLLGALAIRIKCDQLPDGGLEVPFTAGPAEDASLQFAYRVFNPCGKNDPAQCGGDLLIGYRDTAGKSGDIHPLTVVHYAARDLERSKNLDHEIPDVVSFPLPKKLQGKTFNLLVQPKFAAVNRVLADKVPFIFDFIWPGRTQTVYDTEERVYRAYDSSEPPYYIDTRADGSKFETKPLLDLTFDIPGFPVDRSPTRASFDDKTCPLAAMPLNSVQSVSGRGLTIPPGLECDGNIKSSSVPTLSAFTVELWVRKKMACQPPSCPRQAVFRAPGLFSIDLLTDGRIGCTVGSGGALVESDDPLPAQTWTHVALVYDSNGLMHCLINGVPQAKSLHATLAIPVAMSSLQLGERVSLDAIDVDEVRIIGAARSTDEVHRDTLRPLTVGPPRGNLVHIDFDHPKSGTAGQFDQSKAHNDAELISGHIVPGIQGMVFDTQGTGQVKIADSRAATPPVPSTLALTDAVTVELWVNRRAATTSRNPAEQNRLIGKWRSETSPGWRLDVEPVSGRLRWEIVTKATDTKTGAVSYPHLLFVTYETVPTNEWHHVAATYDGKRMRVFKDGLPLHRWCGSGPVEGVAAVSASCTDPPPMPTPCTVEVQFARNDSFVGGRGQLGDAECISGTIDNTQPILAAKDDVGNRPLDGLIDEIRVSNYAKREFEVAASARLASAYTQSIGRQTILRNRLFTQTLALAGNAFRSSGGDIVVCNGASAPQIVDPLSNDLPYDLARQPARELRAFDAQGRLISGIKHVCGQQSGDDYFRGRATVDSMSRNGLLEYPHGEVLVSQADLDGTLKSLTGYGPAIGLPDAQRQAYIADAASTVTGRPARMLYGNNVSTTWTYEDAPVPTSTPSPPGGTPSEPSGAFGPESLKTATVVYQPPPTSPGQPPPPPTTLSDRAYEWDAVGNLKHVHDKIGGGSSAEYDAIYGYDNLRRVQLATIALPGVSTPLTFNFNYCYDALGNLVLIDGRQSCYDPNDPSSTLTLLPLGPPNVSGGDGAIQDYGRQSLISGCVPGSTALSHALTRRERSTGQPALQTDYFCYDASGKMLWSPNRSYTYFARGKAGAITDAAGATSQYAYDGDGVRVSKSEPGKPTQIIISPSYREIVSPSLVTTLEIIYATGGGNVARRVLQVPSTTTVPFQTTDLVWFNNDHLGGTYFLTSLSGLEVANTRAYYRPFGAFAGAKPQLDSSGHRQFTSKEIDATDLYDFGARLYDPVTGRFTQADDFRSAAGARAKNRYSYAASNPLIMIDPSGQQEARFYPDPQSKPPGMGLEIAQPEPDWHRDLRELGTPAERVWRDWKLTAVKHVIWDAFHDALYDRTPNKTDIPGTPGFIPDVEARIHAQIGPRPKSQIRKFLEALGLTAGSALIGNVGTGPKIVSPFFRYGEREIIIVETTAGRQAFYRSSGVNSGKPGAWLPFDEYQPNFGFNKEQYRIGELSPYGTEELKAISEALGEMRLSPTKVLEEGIEVNRIGELEEGIEVNRILDFFKTRTTRWNLARPVPDPGPVPAP